MKKFIMALMLCLVSIVSINATTLYGYTTNTLVWNGYANEWQALDNGYGVKIIIAENEIFINSRDPQYFKIVESSPEHYNQSGHLEITCYAYDNNSGRCIIRVVFRDDPQCETGLQLYIIYNDISYVYNVVIIPGNTNSI